MDNREEFETFYRKRTGCRAEYMVRQRTEFGYRDPHMETHYHLWLVRDAYAVLRQVMTHKRTSDQGVTLGFSSARAASRFMEMVARISRKCDGNHGGAPCDDPECWTRD